MIYNYLFFYRPSSRQLAIYEITRTDRQYPAMLLVFRPQTGPQADGGQEAIRNEVADGRLQCLPSDFLHMAVRPGIPGQQLRSLHL